MCCICLLCSVLSAFLHCFPGYELTTAFLFWTDTGWMSIKWTSVEYFQTCLGTSDHRGCLSVFLFLISVFRIYVYCFGPLDAVIRTSNKASLLSNISYDSICFIYVVNLIHTITRTSLLGAFERNFVLLIYNLPQIFQCSKNFVVTICMFYVAKKKNQTWEMSWSVKCLPHEHWVLEFRSPKHL